MKIINLGQKLKVFKCLYFRRPLVIMIFCFVSFKSLAFTPIDTVSRSPASAFDEDVLVVPLVEQRISIQTIFAEDDAGVMKGMKDQLNSWDAIESYSQKWNLGSTNLYKTPSTKEKTHYITGNLLKYTDKRLAGEIKNSEEGSALHSVAKIEKTLRPNATVGVSKLITIKFNARVLEGKATMEIRNPWIECNTIVNINGKVKVLTKKDYAQLGTSAGLEYAVNESQLVAFVNQEITQNIKAKLSSTSRTNDDADKRLEMMATFPFNL